MEGFALRDIAVIVDTSPEHVRQRLNVSFGLSGEPPARLGRRRLRARRPEWERIIAFRLCRAADGLPLAVLLRGFADGPLGSEVRVVLQRMEAQGLLAVQSDRVRATEALRLLVENRDNQRHNAAPTRRGASRLGRRFLLIALVTVLPWVAVACPSAEGASSSLATVGTRDAHILEIRIENDARQAHGSPSAEVHIETGCCGVRVLTVLYRARLNSSRHYGAYVVQLVTGRGGAFTSARLMELQTPPGYRYGGTQTTLLYQFQLARQAGHSWGVSTYPKGIRSRLQRRPGLRAK